MGKLLAIALVLAAFDLARADEKGPPAPAPAEAPPATAPAPARAGMKDAPAKKGKKAAAGAKGAKAALPKTAPEKPCEPVKPCPID